MKPQKRTRPRDNRDNRDNRHPAKSTPSDLSIDDPHNWDFDGLPAEQWEACCRWEYARESAFIRDAVEKCKSMRRFPTASVNEAFLNLFALGYPWEFFYELPFPEPWQSLDKAERERRAEIYPQRQPWKQPPFKAIGDIGNTGELYRLAQDAQKKLDAAMQRHIEGEAHLDVAGMMKQYQDAPPVSFVDASGVQILTAQINWRDYTNDEIATFLRKWVRDNRPPELPPAPDRRGKKQKDWRDRLTHLAVLRLRGQHTALDIVDPRKDALPKLWKTKQFAGEQWKDITKWEDAKREAIKVFHRLFPSLPEGAQPLSSCTRGDASLPSELPASAKQDKPRPVAEWIVTPPKSRDV